MYLVSHQQRTCRPAIYLSHVATPDLFFAAQSSQTSRTQWNRAYGEVRSSHPACGATCCMTTTKTLDCRDKVRLLLQDSARDKVLRRPGSVPGSLQLACTVPSSSSGHFHVLLLQGLLPCSTSPPFSPNKAQPGRRQARTPKSMDREGNDINSAGHSCRNQALR